MRKEILIVSIALFVIGCSKDTPAPILPPGKAVLVSPANNEACAKGKIISSTQSTILFIWNKSENTDSYELKIKDLLTGITTSQSTSKTELEVTLLRNTPYSWHVISKSTKTSITAQSEVWKFYNAGEGAVSYAPFPAEIITPTMGQNVNAPTGKITLAWKGSDVDGDITGYDVHFGTNTSPALFNSNLRESILNDVSVTSNTTYYWKIITKDSKGNTSDSGEYSFKIN